MGDGVDVQEFLEEDGKTGGDGQVMEERVSSKKKRKAVKF